MAKKKSSGGQTAIVFILLLCILIVTGIALFRKDQQENPDPAGTDTVTVTATQKTDTETPSTRTVTEKTESTKTTSGKPTTNTSGSGEYQSKNDTSSFQKDQWYMLLVNPDNGLTKEYVQNLKNTLVGLKSNKNRLMDPRCAEDMNAMIDAAKKDGVDLLVCSAYRDWAKQETNFNNKMEEFKKKGYTDEKAFAETATIIAVPGTSEHHTGLAADIVTPSYQSLNSGFAKTDAYKWLSTHCAEYGFCLRYMEDKQDITKIIYEPWHYRYVGKEAATIIMNEHMSFEEFVEKYVTE